MFQLSFKRVLGYLKEVLQGSQEGFNGVSRKFVRCFIEVSRVFQESFKGVSR